MAIQVGLGFSQQPESVLAAQEAGELARSRLNGETVDLALVFHTTHYDPVQFHPVLFETLEKTQVVGASTGGIIINDRVETRGILAVAIHSDQIKFENGHVSHLNLQDKQFAGQQFIQSTQKDYGQQHRRLFVFFIDGLMRDISPVMEGIKSQMDPDMPIVGAKASDSFLFEKTYQFFNEKCLNHSICGFFAGGPLKMGLSLQHGWTALGKPRTVDKTSGHIINTIDGKPAISFYEEYFGSDSKSLLRNPFGPINTRYPIGVHLPNQRRYLLQGVIDVQEQGGLILQDKIPQHSEIHLMITNREQILQAAETAAKKVRTQLENQKPELIIMIESLYRYKIFKKVILQELEIIRNILGKDVPLIGMYANGEIFRNAHSLDKNLYIDHNSLILLALRTERLQRK